SPPAIYPLSLHDALPIYVRAVDFIVFNGDKSGVIYVQGWTYDADENGEKIKTYIQDIQSEDASRRELAEKALVAIGRPALEALRSEEHTSELQSLAYLVC